MVSIKFNQEMVFDEAFVQAIRPSNRRIAAGKPPLDLILHAPIEEDFLRDTNFTWDVVESDTTQNKVFYLQLNFSKPNAISYGDSID